jgi:hypothetical protein
MIKDFEQYQDQQLIKLPEGTSYQDFAQAVADVLINDYGQHNYEPFLKALREALNK